MTTTKGWALFMPDGKMPVGIGADGQPPIFKTRVDAQACMMKDETVRPVQITEIKKRRKRK